MDRILQPWGSNFSGEEIAAAVARDGLLSMELELSRECNLRCVYCYASSGRKLHNELTIEEIMDALGQAIELGARRIIIIGGGEPLMYPHLMEIMEFLHGRGIGIDLFTNGTLVTPEIARKLFELSVSPVVKTNSLRDDVQDRLAAVPGTAEAIRRGLANLMEAGYPKPELPLGIETIICRQNIAELPEMWVWARERNIIPYFEMITFQGRAKKNEELNVTSDELHELFLTLSRIDRERYDFAWEPHPPIAALSCNRHRYSCTMNSQGYIQPCTGVDITVGNVRHSSLAEILRTSVVMKAFRRVEEHIKGACSGCDLGHECYGCRGLAYHVTGDFFGADPLCWKNPRKVT
jgi:radical SAM protein with 4Fe4S-binding SPASM domain